MKIRQQPSFARMVGEWSGDTGGRGLVCVPWPFPKLGKTTFPRRGERSVGSHSLVRMASPLSLSTGFGKERRPLDPAPVLQADCAHPHAAVVHVSLVSEKGEPRDFVTERGSLTPILVGTTVATCAQLTDTNGEQGDFFVFNDLSVRIPGRFRLRFQLFDVDFSMLQTPQKAFSAENIVLSDVFVVHSPKDYPGLSSKFCWGVGF